MTRRTTMPSPWLDLCEKAGGVGKLAEALGVSPMTLWRWSTGERTPALVVQQAVNTYARRRGLPEPFPEG